MGIAALLALAAAPAVAGDAEPIRDNSFLLEEAYNQEARVVQHISAWMAGLPDRGWIYAFTDEWPLGGPRHQLSFTLPVTDLADGPSGVGDLFIHYRRQWTGIEAPGEAGSGAAAFTTRLSAMIPTGSESSGLGAGAGGAQLGLALSLERGSRWTAHTNLAATWIGSSPSGSSQVGGNVAQSLVWNAAPALNFLLEGSYSRLERVDCPCAEPREEILLLAPGVRWAHTAASGLQVVPGLSAPIGLGPSRGDRFLFLYLSIEHAF